MLVSKNALDMALTLLRGFEGCQLKPYRDIKGIPTIGIGNISDLEGRPVTMSTAPITMAQAVDLCLKTLKVLAAKLSAMVRVQLADHQTAALLSFQYNEGSEALRTSHLLRFANQREWVLAGNAFMEWVYARENGRLVPVTGLRNRRTRERAVFLGTQTVVPVSPLDLSALPSGRAYGAILRPRKQPLVPLKSVLASPSGLPHSLDTLYLADVPEWVLGHNDKVGDCTLVGVANVILARTTSAGRPCRIADDQVVLDYAGMSGYRPDAPLDASGQNPTDTGLLIEDVLSHWHNTGFSYGSGVDVIDGFATLDVRDYDYARRAFEALGPLTLGIMLPNGWEQSNYWDRSTATGGVAGGHDVTIAGWNDIGPIAISWAEECQMTEKGWRDAVQEAHVTLSKDSMEEGGYDCRHVDWNALSKAMDEISHNRTVDSALS